MADRSVSVVLRAKVTDYIAGIKAAGAATGGLSDEIAKTGKTAKGIKDDLDRVADGMAVAMGRTQAAVSKLDREILTTRTTLRGLAHDFANAEDQASRVDLAERMRKQNDELHKLVSARKLLGDGRDGDDDALRTGKRWGAKVAEGLMSGLADAGTFGGRVFGGLPPQAQAAIGAGAVGAVVAVAPLIGATISGAVVGAVGVGGVVGGLALAAKDPAVQAEARKTGETFSEVFGRASVSFVPVTVDALGEVRGEVRAMEGDFEHVFDSASRYVKPLTRGALGFVDELLPGLQKAIDEGGEAVDELASWGPKLGRLGGEVLGDMAEHADEGEKALHQLYATFDLGIRSLSNTIGSLSTLYGWLEKTNEWTGGGIVENFDRVFGGGERKLINVKDRADAYSRSLDANVTAMQLWAAGVDEMARKGDSAFDAATNLGAAIAHANDLAKHGKDTLDANSKAGRDNRQALSDLAVATRDAATAAGNLSGSSADAQKVMDDGYIKFIKAATGMGLSKTEADKLARSLGLIPSPKVSVTVNTKQANTAIANVVSYLDSVSGKTVTTYIKVKTIGDTDHITSSTGGGRSINRWGGLYDHAAEGVLREAQIASPMGPARYAYAEPATGGELFAPRLGDMNRTRAMVTHAVENWWGGWKNFLPAMTPPPSAPTPAAAAASPAQFAQAIRAALVGVTVQMDGRTVGYIQGREANLLAR